MSYTKNLSTKKLSEFTQDDTIYIRNNKDSRKPLLLCKFSSFDGSNYRVTGRIINCKENESYISGGAGILITASYRDCALYGNATDEKDRSYFRFFDRSLRAMHPDEVHKVLESGVHVEKHPSYGLMRFTRRSTSGSNPLFGSSVQSRNTISLSISKAKHTRDLNNDWFHAENEIIEVEMSQSQFAELITTMNMGEGVPVTIRHINRETMPEPPSISKADLFSAEFSNIMHNFAVDTKVVVSKTLDILKNKATIGKGDREIIIAGIQRLINHFTDNVPFVQKQFQEGMEKVVLEAKSDIEAFVENKIRTAGLEAIANSNNITPLIDNK